MSVPFVDAFGRGVKYLRLSVTDRCDLRCRYCMSEAMTFLPSKELLSFDELDRVARCFIASGVEKIRVTGGEPLVRKGIMELFRGLARHLADGQLRELTLTTNATQLSRHAGELRVLGVRRINISLDTLDPDKFAMSVEGRLRACSRESKQRGWLALPSSSMRWHSRTIPNRRSMTLSSLRIPQE